MKNKIKFTIHKENLDISLFNQFMYSTLHFIDSAKCTFKTNKISLSNITFLNDNKDNELVAFMLLAQFHDYLKKYPNQTFHYSRTKMEERQNEFNNELIKIITEQLQRYSFVSDFKIQHFGSVCSYSINKSKTSIYSVKSKYVSTDIKTSLIELDLKIKQYELIHKTLKNIYKETISWNYFPYVINQNFLREQNFKFDR